MFICVVLTNSQLIIEVKKDFLSPGSVKSSFECQGYGIVSIMRWARENCKIIVTSGTLVDHKWRSGTERSGVEWSHEWSTNVSRVRIIFQWTDRTSHNRQCYERVRIVTNFSQTFMGNWVVSFRPKKVELQNVKLYAISISISVDPKRRSRRKYGRFDFFFLVSSAILISPMKKRAIPGHETEF